jgi:alpha-L-rhamnosidase
MKTMKTIGLLSLILILAAPALATMKPINLKCEYLTDPVGIDILKPRLSWALESDKRGEKQTAYQILVASSGDNLRKNRGDLWDSGKVASRESLHIPYAGAPLKSAMRCLWKVRVWDTTDTPTEFTAASWEMGLLDKSDWHGKWISRTDDKEYHPAPMLRHTFELKGKVKQARVYICGLGYYELHLNGKKVGDRLRDPGYTRFDRRALYATYDVTKQLKEGGNAVGVMLGTGWYNVHTKAVWYFDKAPWRAAPKVLVELRVEYADGRTETIAGDTTWKTSTGPIVYDSIYGGETHDARQEKPGWDTASYDDHDWQAAIEVAPPGGVISAQMNPPIRTKETIKPVKVTEVKPGVYVYDLGQNFAGHARLTASGPAGSQITLRYAEKINKDGSLDPSNINVHLVKTDPPQRFQTDKFILKGQGRETFEPVFTYHGFQYVEVTGYPGKPSLDSLRGIVAHSDIPVTGAFECSNPLLNRIQQATLWSYQSNLQSIPTDCPQREKNGWTGDAHLAAEQGLFNFLPAGVYNKWVMDLDDEQRETGELPGIVPTSGWGYEWGNGPAWDSAFLLIPWYMYQYYGDTRILTGHYPGMKRYVDYLTTKSNNGIVSIGLGDWVPYKTETPVEVTSTAYYYRDALIVSQTASLLGNQADARKYADLAASIKKAFNAKFFNPANGTYSNAGQTALSCALYQGMVSAQDRPVVLANLVKAVDKNNGHIDTGILGAKYLLNTLTDNGRADVAFQVASQKDMPGWGWWLEQGATTLWESWGGTDSRNHIMFGDISAWFYKTLAGINPDPTAPGFGHFIVKPHPVGGLTYAKGWYNSLRGEIFSDWKIENGAFNLRVEIPANTSATVYVPALDSTKVTEDGLLASDAEGVQFLRMEEGYAVYEVGSGKYRFVSAAFAKGR